MEPLPPEIRHIPLDRRFDEARDMAIRLLYWSVLHPERFEQEREATKANPSSRYIAHRWHALPWGDEVLIGIMPAMNGYWLAIGTQPIPPDDLYLYGTLDSAIDAFILWDPDEGEPTAWQHHPRNRRCRPDSDPRSEVIETEL